MKESFLNRVNSIIEQNLGNEDFSVSKLAVLCNSSRSQLHRNFCKHTKKSPSQYIREYRLEKAKELLVNTNLTSSEISYSVGFKSPTYFNTSFRKYFGYTPGEARIRNSINVNASGQYEKQKPTKSLAKSSAVIPILLIFLVASLLVWKQPFSAISKELDSNPKNPKDKETFIIIMPFENLSYDKENDYLVHGFTEDIIHKISKVKNVNVTTTSSTHIFNDEGNLIKDIDRDNTADYLIKGSFQQFQDKFKIIIHLIDTQKNLVQISKSFEGSFDDIFALQGEVSEDIVRQLNLVISPDQLREFHQPVTNNLEAYKLYLKGRYFYYLGAAEFNKLAYDYYLESIAVDPDFAMAYIGLADLIDSSYWPWIPTEKYQEMREYALKAMRLDPSLPDPHKILAKIYMKQDHDWEAAEKAFQRALELEPRHLESNTEYGKFLAFVRGDFKTAQHYFKKVEELDPLYLYNLLNSAEAYMAEGNFKAARQQIEKGKELAMVGFWPGRIYWDSFLIYMFENEHDLAVEELEIGWAHYQGTEESIALMLDNYKLNGINSLFQWFIRKEEGEVIPNREKKYNNGVSVAEHYAFIGKEEEAVDYLKLAINNNNAELFRIKYSPLLKNLRNNPEYLDLLRKLNLGDYTKDWKFSLKGI